MSMASEVIIENRDWDLARLNPFNLDRDICTLPYSAETVIQKIQWSSEKPHIDEFIEVINEYLLVEALAADILSGLRYHAHVDITKEEYYLKVIGKLSPTETEFDRFFGNWLAAIPESHMEQLLKSTKSRKKKAWLTNQYHDGRKYQRSNPENTSKYHTALEESRSMFEKAYNNIFITHPVKNTPLNIASAKAIRSQEPDKEVRTRLRLDVKTQLEKFMPVASKHLEQIYKLRFDNGDVDAFNTDLEQLSLSPTSWNLILESAQNHQQTLEKYHQNKEIILGFTPGPDDFLDDQESTDTPIQISTTINTIQLAWNNISTELGDIVKFIDKHQLIFTNRQGSKSGVFAGMWIGNPLIALNWHGRPDNARSLAHELGHGIHSYLRYKHDNNGHRTSSTINETMSFFSELLFHSYKVEAGLLTLDHTQKHMLGSSFNGIYWDLSRIDFENNLLHKVANSEPINPESVTSTYIDALTKWGQSNLVKNYSYIWPSLTHMFNYTFNGLMYLAPRILSNVLFQNYLEAKKTGNMPSFAKKLIRMASLSDSHTTSEILKVGDLDIEDSYTWERGLKQLSQPIVDLHHELTK